MLEYFDGLVKFSRRCCHNNKNVFGALEPGRHIGCDLTVALKSKILGLVWRGEGVSAYFELCAEVILVGLQVASQVVLGLGMTEQNGFTSTYGLTLSFKTVVRVLRVNDPNIIKRAVCVHACLLVSADWGVSCWTHGHRANCEGLFVEVGVRLNSDLLPETDDIVSAKDVNCFKTLEYEH